jgi:hypothetical protein
LVYGIAVIIQNKYKNHRWNNMEVQRTTAEIDCDENNIEMTPVTYEAQTCGTDDTESEDMVYTSDAIFINTKHNTSTL